MDHLLSANTPFFSFAINLTEKLRTPSPFVNGDKVFIEVLFGNSAYSVKVERANDEKETDSDIEKALMQFMNHNIWLFLMLFNSCMVQIEREDVFSVNIE